MKILITPLNMLTKESEFQIVKIKQKLQHYILFNSDSENSCCVCVRLIKYLSSNCATYVTIMLCFTP
jgi:hypothetical protein